MYRYSNKKYNELLFKMGIIRIGTLYDFRNSEHKKGIADPKEGTKSIIHNKDLQIDSTGSLSKEQESILKGYEEVGAFQLTAKPRKMSITNFKARRGINSHDYFILCTAKTYNVVNEFEGYDSCYKITHPNEFYRDITIALNRIVPIKFLGCFDVVYQDRIEEWEENGNKIHPALIKESEFKGQEEIRAIWEPIYKNIPIEPILLASYKLGKYMEHQPLN